MIGPLVRITQHIECPSELIGKVKEADKKTKKAFYLNIKKNPHAIKSKNVFLISASKRLCKLSETDKTVSFKQV